MKKRHLAIASVAVLFVFLLAPFLARYTAARRQLSRKNGSQRCINTLRIIQSAKDQWAHDNGVTNPMAEVRIEDIAPYLKNGKLRECHVTSEEVYMIGKLREPPRCRIHGTADRYNQPWWDRQAEIWKLMSNNEIHGTQ